MSLRDEIKKERKKLTEIYFVRHGQSVANVEHFFAGNTDTELSPLGITQAEKTAEYFRNIHIDKIYASPLIRAWNTGKAIADLKGLEMTAVPDLREVFAGDWETKPFEVLEKEYPEDYAKQVHDIGNCRCTNGESVGELQERVHKAVNKIVADNPGKVIVIATHATPIRAMECIWKGIDLDGMKSIPWVTNASITHVRYNDENRCEILERSFDGHLGDLVSSLPANV